MSSINEINYHKFHCQNVGNFKDKDHFSLILVKVAGDQIFLPPPLSSSFRSTPSVLTLVPNFRRHKVQQLWNTFTFTLSQHIYMWYFANHASLRKLHTKPDRFWKWQMSVKSRMVKHGFAIYMHDFVSFHSTTRYWVWLSLENLFEHVLEVIRSFLFKFYWKWSVSFQSLVKKRVSKRHIKFESMKSSYHVNLLQLFITNESLSNEWKSFFTWEFLKVTSL
jgi:hypothetical protein